MNIILIRLWHRLRRTHSWRFVPGYELHGTIHHASLVCDSCGIVRAITLEPGHPKSLTAELSESEEALLAQIEATEWPETADIDHCRDVLERVYPLDYLGPGDT